MLAPNPMAGQTQMPTGQQAGNGPMFGGPMTEPPAPQAPPPKFHDVTIVTKKTYSCARVEGVPPEEFGIARNARNIQDCGYCFHELTTRTEADLISQGYDAAQVKALQSYTMTINQETLQRDTVDEGRNSATGDDGLNSANRIVRVTEHYVRMDYSGDDKPALYRVTTGGELGDILKRSGKEDIEEVDEIPFAAMTPVIVTHRFFGRSIADLVMDIQRIKTALLRGALDNLYAHNNPRAEIAEESSNDSTIDDFLESRHGGMIRVKRSGAVNWQEVPNITDSIYPALQYFDAVREWRTGVTRQGQGVDPNALQNQVATIANQMAEAAQAKTKLIARIFAETGIKDLFSLLHGLIRKNGQQAETVRLRNKWVNVDPRDWKERNDLTVNVGLGTGTKTQQLGHVMAIIGLQKEALAAGKTNLVSDDNLYNAAREAVKLGGLKKVDEYFTDPKTQPQPAPAQDPKMMEIQAKAAAEQQKMAADQQHQTAQFQRDTAHEKLKLEADTQIQHTKTQAEIALANQKFELERELKMIDAQIKREQHAMDMQAKQHEMAMKGEQHQRELQHKTQLHEMNIQGQEIKQAPGKDKANKTIIGPLVEQLGKHMADMHQETVKAITAPRKRKVKAPSGKTYEVEG